MRRWINTTDAGAGHLWSLDLGAAMRWAERPSASLTLQNALSDISWNEDDFEVSRYSVMADFDSTTQSDTIIAFADLPEADQAEVRAFLDDADLPRRLTLAGSYLATPQLSVSVDYTELIGGELRSRWDHIAAAGAELRLLDALPLRAGLAINFEALSHTGGVRRVRWTGALRLLDRAARVPGCDGLILAL